jgi:hypothetical protein
LIRCGNKRQKPRAGVAGDGAWGRASRHGMTAGIRHTQGMLLASGKGRGDLRFAIRSEAPNRATNRCGSVAVQCGARSIICGSPSALSPRHDKSTHMKLIPDRLLPPSQGRNLRCDGRHAIPANPLERIVRQRQWTDSRGAPRSPSIRNSTYHIPMAGRRCAGSRAWPRNTQRPSRWQRSS